MAEKEPRTPTHIVYSVVAQEGKGDLWLSIGLLFVTDNNCLDIILHALPFNGRLVCRKIIEGQREATFGPPCYRDDLHGSP